MYSTLWDPLTNRIPKNSAEQNSRVCECYHSTCPNPPWQQRCLFMARVCKYLEPHFKIQHKSGKHRQVPAVVWLSSCWLLLWDKLGAALIRSSSPASYDRPLNASPSWGLVVRERWEKLSTERRVACIRSRQLRPSLKRLPTQWPCSLYYPGNKRDSIKLTF